jgi:thiamine pyrophosphokinase
MKQSRKERRAAGKALRDKCSKDAHAKSSDAAMISGYVGSSSRFDKAVAKFALTYAEQNERDYKTLLKAIRDG